MDDYERFLMISIKTIILIPLFFIIFTCLFFFYGLIKVDALANINLINSWGSNNNSCTNCSSLTNSSNFSGFGYQRSSYIFDGSYIDISFSGTFEAQSTNAVNLNISSYMVTIKGSTNSSNITNWCTISYRDINRYEDHYSISYDIHCSGQVHGHTWDLVIIDFYLNQRSQAGGILANEFTIQSVSDSNAINNSINNSTNSIINNNNNNTQSIIDNQNKNSQETNDKLDEANETNKGILETIKNLPSIIINGFIDMLKSLFIPSEDDLNEIINKSTELSENFGFVGESFNFIIRLFTSICGMINGDGCLMLPSLELKFGGILDLEDYTMYNEVNVCMSDNPWFGRDTEAIDIVRTITTGSLLCAYIGFAISQLNSILSKEDTDI